MRPSASVLAFLLALGGVAATAQEDKEGDDPFAFTLDVKEKVLENGFRVLVAPRKGAPRVACAVWFRVGSVDEQPGKTGLAHVLEHMMFKGTHRIGVKDAALGDKLSEQMAAVWDRKRALVARLGEDRVPRLRGRERGLIGSFLRLLTAGEDLAAISSETVFLGANAFHADEQPYFQLREVEEDFHRLVLEERRNDKKEELWDTYVQAGGTNLNAYTTEDTTQYIVTLPSNKLELFFWLEADRLTDPVFREWYPERDVVKEERRNDENASDGAFYEGLNAVVFGPHPYGHPILGWMKDLDNLRPEDARGFFLDHYSPDNATCVLAGDLDPAATFALAERYLGKIPRRKGKETLVPAEPTCPGEKRFTMESEAEPRVEICWRGPEPGSRDRDVLDVIGALLSGETGRLYKALVEEEPIALSVDASLDNHRFAGRFHVSAHGKPETELDKLEASLDAEVAALTTELVTEEELSRAKNRIATEVVRGLEDLEGIVDRLGQGAAILGDWHRFVDRARRVRSVTAEEVRAVARKTFKTAGRTVGVLARGSATAAEPAPDADPAPPPTRPHPKPGHRQGGTK